MFDDMPDDWREAIDEITADWTESLDDLIGKHTEAEFLKHAAAAGANFDLVQTEALKKLIAEDVGFIAATNKEIAKSLITDIEQLLIVKGDWASAKEAVFDHINKVFSGQEKIVIDNIGKSVKRVVLDKELGHAVIRDFVVKRKWVGNIDAYSDMVARSLSQKARSMGDFEGYRTTYGIIGWRRMSSLGGKTCGICASLHGRDYYFTGDRASILPDDDGFMFEPHPNGYCYQTPIYDDWVGIKNLSDSQLDDHVKQWKIDNKIAIPNLKRVPTTYGRIVAPDRFIPISTADVAFNEFVYGGPTDKYDTRTDLSRDELRAVSQYNGAAYREINQTAAGKYDPAFDYTLDELTSQINNLDSVIAKSILNEDVVLYRGLYPHVAEDLIKAGGRKNLGFASTTMDPQKTRYYMNLGVALEESNIKYVMVMERKKGQTGLFISKTEYEVLLPRNLEYKVTKIVDVDTMHFISGDDQNVKMIFVEAV